MMFSAEVTPQTRGRKANPCRNRTSRPIVRVLSLVFIIFIVYSTLIEPHELDMSRHEVYISGLPKSFDGFKIVQISDTHLGFFTKPEDLRKVTVQVNAIHPDMVVLTGDYVHHSASNIEPVARAMSSLRARYGVHAVLGGHDYWADGPRMAKAMKHHGIDVMFNESREITIGEDTICLVGLDDLWEGDTHYDKAFRGIRPGEVCIGITHNPDTVQMVKNRNIALLMAGHTHGGQINLPLIGPVVTATRLGPRYASGTFRIGKVRMYISRGVGQGIPLRFRCSREAPVFVLRRLSASR